MKQHITLRVVIDGDNVKDSFILPTEARATVKDLRSAIKRNINQDRGFSNSVLRDILVERLELWWLAVPWPYPFSNGKVIEFDENEEVLLDGLATKRRLSLDERIADVFNEASSTTVDGRVFVVVKVAQ
ncbi:hypothetical protein EC991_004234, partial [Linnemannia zychae]